MRPDMAILGWDVLDDVVRGCRHDVFRGAGLRFVHATLARILLEVLDRGRDLLHEVGVGGARELHPHPPKQQKERTGGAQQRVLVGRDDHVALEDQRPALFVRIDRGRPGRLGAHPIVRSSLEPAGRRREGRLRESGLGARRDGSRRGRSRVRRRTASARIGHDDRALATTTERSERIRHADPPSSESGRAHRRPSSTAHSSSSSSGHSPEKCMPIELATENSGQSGDCRSSRKYTWSEMARICGGGVGR